MSGAYYNEHDPAAAAWLRELIKRGLIADGEVDERSIEDVVPTELLGFTQCHFFAGIGVWSYALRLSGWPDDRPVWTGSCPCQPFSAAGKGAGFADERHLWPAFLHLIAQCGPERVYGEQVASADGLAWLDLVSTDLEAVGYACGAVPAPVAGFGAPHIRQRLFWVADADGGQFGQAWAIQPCGQQRLQPQGRGNVRQGSGGAWSGAIGLADAGRFGRQWGKGLSPRGYDGRTDAGWVEGHDGPVGVGQVGTVEPAKRPGPTNGFWRDADWLGCRDGKWRPVEPGTFPLAYGAPARVVRLRGYGNAISPWQAAEFIRASEEALSAAA